MAALMTLSQLSGGNAVFESYYRQIWDLADSDRKGYLDKRGFFIALRLVASAQGGNDISLNNLNQTAAAPKFRDTDSQLLSGSTTAFDSQWAIRPDEKGKFEGIFESLSPVNGLLSGEKVRPVLINSKLPLDVLGKIWDLSDVDKDGHLDKEEFTVALHLVYRAMEKEPVPSSLPPSLIPPSKRKKSANALPGAVAVLPALSGLTSGLAPLKDTLRSTPTLGGTASPLGRTASPVGSSSSSLGSITSHTPSPTNLSPQHSFKSTSAPAVNWVVSVVDKAKYDELFTNTDIDNNGCITGTDIIEIFMQSNLSQTMLAQIWGLADTKQTGKLNREQFALAMHLIQQKVNKGIDPPSALTSDMIPPSERTPTSAAGPSYLGLLPSLRPDVASAAKTRRDSTSSVGSVELTGIKELDDLSQEIAQLQREKLFLEQAIREKEETIRSKNSDVQDMQSNLDRESSGLHSLESQKQDAQGRLDEMDQQRSKLEGMLNEVKQKCQEESQLISSLQSQIRSRETNLRSQEDELSRTRADLSRLQEEESQLEQRLLSGRVQLDSVVKSLKSTQEEINQARSKLLLIQDSQKEMTRTIDQYNNALSEINKGNLNNLPDLSEGSSDRENGGVRNAGEAFKSKLAMFNNSSTKEPSADPFLRDDPFKYDLMKDPFGEDPFKENDPFKGTSPEDFFKTTDKSDLFGSADPFSRKPTPPVKPSAFSSGDPFKSSSPKPKDSDLFGRADPFGGRAGGFADFSKMSKKSDSPAVPSKKSIPNRPAPPYGSEHMKFGNESQQLEWVKRESEREEQERRRRLRLQEQQDLELAIALSKADISDA
uniref:Epidermal growth factor receptor pathway substrate 15 like 1 n=1 Tax=Nothobranchius furzeri TaxID=105023 RepID=A0A8C6KXI1_NOTFU